MTSTDAPSLRDRIESGELAALLDATEKTPLIRLDSGLYLKDETSNPSGCFKLRSMLRMLLAQQSSPTSVVTASSGNTGIALGIAARALDLEAEVWMTTGSSAARRRAVRDAGARVRVEGDQFSDTAEAARTHAHELGASFISPGLAGPFIEGHRAIFGEIRDEIPSVDVIYVPSGGGGLLSAAVLERSSWPRAADTRLVGVQTRASHPLFDLFHDGRSMPAPETVGYAESLSGDIEDGAAILDLISLVDDIQLVTRQELRRARELVRDLTHFDPELGGSAGIVAALRMEGATSGPAVAVLTGGRRPQRVPPA